MVATPSPGFEGKNDGPPPPEPVTPDPADVVRGYLIGGAVDETTFQDITNVPVVSYGFDNDGRVRVEFASDLDEATALAVRRRMADSDAVELPGGNSGPTDPPASSPTPTVLTGPDAAIVRYTPVVDAQAYDLYVAQGSMVDQGDGTFVPQPPAAPPAAGDLHTRGAPPGLYVRSYPAGGLISLDDGTAGDGAVVPPAYFALVARNTTSDGTELVASPSPWVMGQRGKLDADTFRAGLLLATELISESIETQGINMAGQTWNDETGFTIPGVVNFPPNDTTAASVTAQLIARSLTVLNFLQLQGKQNDVSTGAELVMSTGVTAPPQPTGVSDWPAVLTLQVPAGVDRSRLRGLTGDASHWYCLDSGASVLTVMKFDRSTGALVLRKSFSASNDGLGGVSLNISGGVSQLLILGRNNDGVWRITRIPVDLSSSTTATLARTTTRTFGTWSSDRQLAIEPNSGSTFSIVGMVKIGSSTTYSLQEIRYYLDEYTQDYYFRTPLDGTVNNPVAITTGRPPGYGGQGDARMMVWPQVGNPITYDYEPGSSTLPARKSVLTAEAFPRANGEAVLGVHILDGYHYSLNNTGVVYLYNRDQLVGQVAISYLDNDTAGTGKHETALSPTLPLSVARGAGALVTVKPVNDNGDPDSPNAINVYSRAGTTGTFRLLAEIAAESTSYRVFLHSSTGTAYPTVATDFSAANLTPARVRAQSGGLELRGDSGGSVGTAGFRDSMIQAFGLLAAGYRAANTTQSAASGVAVVVALQGTPSHSSARLTLGTDSTVTILDSGLYSIGVRARFSPSTAGARVLNVETFTNQAVSEGVPILEEGLAAQSSGSTPLSGQTDMYLPAGTKLRVWARQNSGSTLTLNNIAQLNIRRVG